MKKRKITAFIILAFIEYFVAFLIVSAYREGFKRGFKLDANIFFNIRVVLIFFIFLGVSVLAMLLGYDKRFWVKNSLDALSDGEKKQILGNLEQARFQEDMEIDKNFTKVEYSKLKDIKVTGVPVRAVVKGNKYCINLAPSAHTMVIGSTGSGKTTSFINPTIQILSQSKTKPSMLIADPKGELLNLHAKSLEEKGYEVQVLDLRSPYNSVKWNPLEKVYENYQKMLELESYVNSLDKEDLEEINGSQENVDISEAIVAKNAPVERTDKSEMTSAKNVLAERTAKSEMISEKNIFAEIANTSRIAIEKNVPIESVDLGKFSSSINIENGIKSFVGYDVLHMLENKGKDKVLENADDKKNFFEKESDGFEGWEDSENPIESEFIAVAYEASIRQMRKNENVSNKDTKSNSLVNENIKKEKGGNALNREIDTSKFGNGPWEFEQEIYYDIKDLVNAIKVEKQKLFDEVYEDCNDFVSILCPVKNKKDPLWESGAKSFILSILIAMLEDSEDKKLGMTKEKFNFYNLTKIALNTQNDCKDLIKYFEGRGELSKSTALSKQVLDSLDRTRGSYLSTIFDKLNLFSDLSICSLTSANEIEFEDMASKSVALFLQIPDEKETRHTLAAMVVLQAYKDLVASANAHQDLSLPRPVYFILDEFGNLPRINKLEQMITVGRSRNLWLFLVLQSYAQLANVYDEKISEIIRSNCNIQIFIGSTDSKTLESFSKHCGNYSVATKNVSFNTANSDNLSSSVSVKERPLIYPSELSKLNNPLDMGNAIVTVFGYNPIRSKYTPSFLVPMLDLKETEIKGVQSRYFDETSIFYDMKIRNEHYEARENAKMVKGHILSEFKEREQDMNAASLIQQADKAVVELLSVKEREKLGSYIAKKLIVRAIELLEHATKKARSLGKDNLILEIDRVRKHLESEIDRTVNNYAAAI